MADRKAQPGEGDVPIMLGGEQVILKPSLAACQQINKLAGNSLLAAVARVSERLDFDFVVEVISIGLDATSPALKKQVAEQIYQQGVISVAADCVLYIRTVMNGGRRPDDDEVMHAMDLVDQLGSALPDDLRQDHVPALEQIRNALIAKVVGEGEGQTEDPLAESASQLENSTAD